MTNLKSKYRFYRVFNYDNIIFWNPGSTGAIAADSEYPYYNEVLGVFNMMNTPKLRKKITNTWYDRHTRQEQKIEYRIPDDLKFVVNPASRLQAQDIQAYLIISGSTYNNALIRGDSWTFETFNSETKMYEYRSAPINVGCLKDKIFTVLWNVISSDGSREWEPDGGISMKLVVNFKRTDDPSAQNVLYTAKFPVIIVTNEAIGTVNPPANCTRTVAPQSSDAVKTFCTDATGVYRTSTRFSRPYRGEEQFGGYNDVNVMVFPNPAESYFKVFIESIEEGQFELRLYNALGIEVFKVTTAHKQIQIPTDSLQKGFYYLHIVGQGKIIKKQILIRK